MDGDGAANWRPTQGDGPAAGGVDPNAGAPAGGDWRTQHQPEERNRIVYMIMETLKKHLPVSMPEGLNELHKIAVRFEEKIYTAAINQSDYLRKISLKIVSMESQTKTQQNLGNAQVIPNQNPPGPVPGLLAHPQGSNLALSSTTPLMSQQNQLQQPQQHMMSQFQSQPNQLQQQWLQTSAGMLLQQNNIDKQKQYVQAQMGLQEAPSTAADSTAQTGHPGTSDLQEELYQMIKSLKDQYFAELNDLYNKISIKIQHIENHMPAQKSAEQYEKIKGFKVMLERLLHFLQVNKSGIQPGFREKIPVYERQILTIVSIYRNKHSGGPAPRSNTSQQHQESQGLQQHDSHTNQKPQASLPSSINEGKKRKKLRCRFCKKVGHLKKDCLKRKIWFEKKGVAYDPTHKRTKHIGIK